MTKDDIQDYIRECADLFGLKDWIVAFVDEKPEGEDALGEAVSTPHCKDGYIRVADNFWTETPEKQRYVVAHELAHFHLRDIRNACRDPLYDGHILGHEAYKLFFYSIDTAIERAVDGIAMSIAKYFPLPPALPTGVAK